MRVLISVVPHKSEIHRSRFAWLSISNSIRWSYIRPDKTEPQSLLDFRDSPSLHLRRLNDDATWADVKKIAYPRSTSEGPGFVVCGKYSKPYRFQKNAEILIVFGTDQEREECLHAVRMRISPWNSIHKNMHDFALISHASLPSVSLDSTSSVDSFDCLVESILNLGGEHSSNKKTAVSSFFKSLKHRIDLDDVPSRTPTLVETVFLILNQLSESKEVLYTIVYKNLDPECILKCISLVSSLFQIFTMGVTLAQVFDQIKKYRPRMNKVYEAIILAMVKVICMRLALGTIPTYLVTLILTFRNWSKISTLISRKSASTLSLPSRSK